MCFKFLFGKSKPVYVCDYVDSCDLTPRGARQYQYGSNSKWTLVQYDDVSVLQIKRV